MTRILQGDSVPESMRERLESACEFGMWMTTPDGTVQRIGDADDSRSIRIGAAPLWDFRNLLNIGAILFGRADVKAVSGPFSEDALWLLGAKATKPPRLPSQYPTTTFTYFSQQWLRHSGRGWGPEDHHLCFDGGPIGAALHATDIPSFTHGHANLLSLTLSTFGKPVLVDAGYFTFNGPPDWHRYCRDVEGHNTILVDGMSPG